MSTKKKAPAEQLIDSLLDDDPTGAPVRAPPSSDDRGKSGPPSIERDLTFSGISIDLGDSSRSLRETSLAPMAVTDPSEAEDDGAKTMVLPTVDRKDEGPSDNTIDLASRRAQARPAVVDRKTGTELRPQDWPMRENADRVAKAEAASISARGASLGGIGSTEAALKQSESLRIAQARINDLEREVERVRRESERLAAAGDALRRRADELLARAEGFESQARESAKARDEEAQVFRAQLAAKERELAAGRTKIDEFEHRLDVNFKKIRVREQQLEHRLEIAKMESATLASAKDRMILDLKRQIDQLSHESEHAKAKSQEMYGQFRAKQDVVRRVVRALRLALTMLEGEDESPGKQE